MIRKFGLTLTLLISGLSALASIAVPNLLTAMNRSRQKRTMADMRTAATAWEARATDRNTYVVGKSGRITFEELRRALEPTYVKHLDGVDGWGNPFQFTSNEQHYSIRAFGSDHRADAVIVSGPTTDFARDIIYEDGTFLMYPEGV